MYIKDENRIYILDRFILLFWIFNIQSKTEVSDYQ